MKHYLKAIGRKISVATLIAFLVGSVGFGFTQSVQIAHADPTDAPITNVATGVTSSDATLNGLNGASDAVDSSFWVSTSTFSVASSAALPEGVYSTPLLGPVASTTPFSALLSSVTGLPSVTADTTYYYAAWTDVNGTWSPGEVLNFTTASAVVTPPSRVKVTIEKFVNGEQATASSSNNADFTMFTTYNSVETGAGSGNYNLSAGGFNGDPTPYQAKTGDMTPGADYSTNEVENEIVGASCSTDQPFALVGYTTGETLAEAASSTPTATIPAFVNLTSDKFVIVWNKTCSSDVGTIGGDVTGGASSTPGVLHVTGVTAVKTTAVADGTFENGWKYIFNITIPTNEKHVSMKFADWMSDVGSTTLSAANNMRISSAQADNSGATVTVTAANTYTLPALNMVTDLDPSTVGDQVQVVVEVAVPSTTVNGSYSTSYGVKTQ